MYNKMELQVNFNDTFINCTAALGETFAVLQPIPINVSMQYVRHTQA